MLPCDFCYLVTSVALLLLLAICYLVTSVALLSLLLCYLGYFVSSVTLIPHFSYTLFTQLLCYPCYLVLPQLLDLSCQLLLPCYLSYFVTRLLAVPFQSVESKLGRTGEENGHFRSLQSCRAQTRLTKEGLVAVQITKQKILN